MNQFGQNWNKKSRPELMEAYFGEGMGHIWSPKAEFYAIGKTSAPSPRMPKRERKFFGGCLLHSCTKRVLTMLTGWPQPFRGYTPEIRSWSKNFSERIRTYLEGLKEKESLFPVAKKIKEPIREVLNSGIFHGASLSRSTTAGQKEVRLNVDGDLGRAISYMAWSTGQREFLPLLLRCYELLPASKITKREGGIEWVVIEEPEMGLHPMGTFAVMTLNFGSSEPWLQSCDHDTLLECSGYRMGDRGDQAAGNKWRSENRADLATVIFPVVIKEYTI